MTIQQALDIINDIKYTPRCVSVTLPNAHRRVLSCDVLAKLDMPSFTNSAMDGFAYHSGANGARNVVGEIYAGDDTLASIQQNQAMRIMTGAMLPDGADSVLKIEDASFDEQGNLLIPSSAKAGDNVRHKGEEFSAGAPLLRRGDICDSIRLMMLASQGIYSVQVYDLPRVGLFASGDELRAPFASSAMVYDSNTIGISALLGKYAPVDSLGILDDDYASVCAHLGAYLHYDLIVTIGAASVGDKDYMHQALSELGFERIVGGLKIKPAGPTKIYQKGDKFVLVLPGNPMSAYFGASIFGVALLHKLMGANHHTPSIVLKSSEELKVKNGRQNLVLCNIKDDRFVTFKAGRLSSGQISPLNLCTHYANIDQSMDLGQDIRIYELDK